MNLQTVKLSQHILNLAFKASCDADVDSGRAGFAVGVFRPAFTDRKARISPTDVLMYRHAYRRAKHELQRQGSIYAATTAAENFMRYLEMVGAERAVRSALIAGVP